VRPPGVAGLARQSAAETLRRIGAKELGLSILPWVVLMAGGGEPGVIAEWVRLALRETNDERRTTYAGLALVFADKTGCLPAWRGAMEGLNMTWKSQVIEAWRQEGRDEGREQGRLAEKRADLLEALAERFKVEVPTDLAQMIASATDLAVLSRWFRAALTEPSLEAFRSAVQSAPPTGQTNGAAGAP
jgi:hypothetical protein